MTDDTRKAYDGLIALLRDGAERDWELAAQIIEGFPHSTNGVYARRWILNTIDCGSLACLRWMLARGVELSFWDAAEPSGRRTWMADVGTNTSCCAISSSPAPI